MNVTCPRCPTTWRHREATGHCANCHRTFIGVTAFDRHQRITDGGRSQCLDPTDLTRESGDALYEPVTRLPVGATGQFWRLAATAADRARLDALIARRA